MRAAFLLLYVGTVASAQMTCVPASGSCSEDAQADCLVSVNYTPDPNVSCATNCGTNYGLEVAALSTNTGCLISMAACEETDAINEACQNFNQNAQTCVGNYNFLMEISDGEYASEAAAELAMCAAGIWEGYSETCDGAVAGYSAQVTEYQGSQTNINNQYYTQLQACVAGCSSQ